MRRSMVLALVLLACATGRPPAASSSTSSTPRDMVVRLLEVGIGTADADVIAPLLAPTYRQHNPRVADGPDGLLGFVREFRSWPESARPKVKVVRTLVDGEYVLAHTQYKRRGYVAAFDLFRV